MARLIDQPVIDGYPLVGVAMSDFEVTPRPAEAPITRTDGSIRVQAEEWGDGYPDRLIRYSWTIAWARLRSLEGLVAAILSRPGAHTFTDWRRVMVSWAADGARSEWNLPWPLATEELDLPPLSPAEEIEPQAGADPGEFLPSSTPTLTAIPKDPASYAAGTPAAGEVWIDSTNRLVKVEAAPTAGTVLYLRLVPMFRVAEVSADPQKPNFVRSPLSLRLGEVRW